jgi:hypothetical protein
MRDRPFFITPIHPLPQIARHTPAKTAIQVNIATAGTSFPHLSEYLQSSVSAQQISIIDCLLTDIL